MNRNIYSNIHKSKGGFNGLICNFEKQDSMNNHIASRSTASGDSTILLDPRPLNSNLQTNKTRKITTPFESVKTTNSNGNINSNCKYNYDFKYNYNHNFNTSSSNINISNKNYIYNLHASIFYWVLRQKSSEF